MRLILAFCLILFFLVGCNFNDYLFQETHDLSTGWAKEKPVSYTFEPKDSLQSYNLELILRNNNQYPYSNIYLFTTLESPDGNIIKDTLEYQLAFASGEWIGAGMGNIKQNILVVKENLLLSASGKYNLEVTHGMRVDTLQGLEDISLTLTKSNSTNKE